MRTFLFSLLWLLFFLPSAHAESDTPEVMWHVASFPPFHITNGPYKEMGICDQSLHDATEVLDDYTHSISQTPFKRMLQLMKVHPLDCSTCLLKTKDREVFLHYSKPLDLSFGNGLIVHERMAEAFIPYTDAQGVIDLKSALEQGGVVIGIAAGRRYGNDIDAIIDPYKETKQIVERTGIDLAEGLLRMVLSKRKLHAIISYPQEYRFLTKKLGVDDGAFKYHPIKGAIKIVQSYLACSKTDEGLKLVEAFNRNIKYIRRNQHMSSFIWSGPETIKLLEPYWEIFKKGNEVDVEEIAKTY